MRQKWKRLSAAAAVLFMYLQKYYVDGLTGGVKG